MKRLLLLATLTIAGLAQAVEPTQVAQGAIAQSKFDSCMLAGQFGEYAHTVQDHGGHFSDYLRHVGDQGYGGRQTQAPSDLAVAVGRYVFLEHGKARVFDACMKDPSTFRINF